MLEELNVHVTRYNLYEIKNTITTLSQSVVEADGVVFATKVDGWVWDIICRHFEFLLLSMQTRAEHHLLKGVSGGYVTYYEREVVVCYSSNCGDNRWSCRRVIKAYVDDTTDLNLITKI